MFDTLQDFQALLVKIDVSSKYVDAFIVTKPLLYPNSRPNKETRIRRKAKAAKLESYRQIFISHVRHFSKKLIYDVEKYDDEKFGEETLYDLLLNNKYILSKDGNYDDDLMFDVSDAFEKAQDKDLHAEFTYHLLNLALHCVQDEYRESIQELLNVLDFKTHSPASNGILSALPNVGQFGHFFQTINEHISSNTVIDGRELATKLKLPDAATNKISDLIGTIDLAEINKDPSKFNALIDKFSSSMSQLRIPNE